MKHLYIKKEAKSNFHDWTVHGLAFLLQDSTLSPDIKERIESKLASLQAVEP